MTPSNYILIAKEDLHSSMILLKNDKFPQALFFTDQAIEKLCKHIIIKSKIIPEEKLKRKIGHNSTKVFDIIINYLIENIDKKHNNEYSFFTSELKAGKDYLIKLREIGKSEEFSESEIKEFLDKIRSFIFSSIPNPYNDLFLQEPDELLKTLIDMNLLDSDTVNLMEERFKDEMFKAQFLDDLKASANDAPKYQNYILALITLAGIFSSHLESTRYPTLTTDLMPQDRYNKENIIIKYLDEFQILISELIKGLEKLKL
jgi:hypothetical protein